MSDPGPDAATTDGMVEQSIAGRDTSIVWDLVEQVEAAFRAECAANTGAEMLDLAEKTNAILRTAWPFVLYEMRRLRGPMHAVYCKESVDEICAKMQAGPAISCAPWPFGLFWGP